MSHTLINPSDSLARQNEKLLKIADTLMRRVEQSTEDAGAAYAQFQRAVMLEEEVRARTEDLERALDLLNESNARLAEANRETLTARTNLANAIETVQEGFALFNAQDVLVLCNSRFGLHMPDIRHLLKPGLSFSEYIRIASESVFLWLPENMTTETWREQRLKRHAEASVIFNVRMTGKRWVQISERRTPDGGTVILQTDVTDIMRLERQERDRIRDTQASRIRATLDHLEQGVCIFDNLGRLVGWNQRVGELLSIPAGRFHIGRRFATVFGTLRDNYRFSPGASPDQVEAWVNRKGKRAPLNFELHGLGNKDLTVFMQQMPDGGFVISFTDVTSERHAIRSMIEAKEMLEQRVLERTLELEDALSDAERANASKSRFVAAASHDLLQPLSAAKLYVAALEQDPGLSAGSGAMLSKAGNALQSVEHILGALLDISRLDSGQASVHLSTVSLDDLLVQLTDELAPAARAKGLHFRVRRCDSQVRSDATYLRRILQNLLSNAVRYTDSGGVLVGTRRTRRGLRVEVWDTGPGIAEHEQEAIFGEFQRLHASASAAEGLGLGLAIVERACALLRHPLELKSRVGHGSVFSVELPLAARAPAAGPAAGTPDDSAPAAPLHNLIVLLIEDDDALRNALTVTIEGWGSDVLPCRDEAGARALLDEIDMPPDVIVADMQLEAGGSGVEAIRNLRARHGNLPACIISATRSPEIAQAARQVGVPLIHKPIDPETLHRFLESARPA